MATFKSRRELLNPFFEGYKLSLIAQEDAVNYYNISEHPATQSTSSTKTLLTFKEVQSRISHNHLASDGHRAVYVDADFNLVVIDVEPFSCRVVFEIPRPVQTESSDGKHKEYPSAAFADSLLCVSDGAGTIYVLEANTFALVSSHQLPSEPDTPLRIHSVDSVSPQSVTIIVSSRNYEPVEATTLKLDYDVRGLRLDFSGPDAPPRMSIGWHRRGEDVPFDVFYRPSSTSHILLGTSPYRSLNMPPAPSYTPSSDEMAPIPRENEALDAKPLPTPPPPYSWYQTSDSLTVAFPLPSTTDRSQIHVQFTAQTLSLHVEAAHPSDFVFPEYDSEALWAPIDISSSVWTWDREADHAFGLLTLHLEKQHEGTKWMQLFSSAATDARQEVPETIDPSELVKVRESLEKYTAALRDGDDLSGLGLGQGVPSLAEGEMDDEVDASVGRRVTLTTVPLDGGEGVELDPLSVLSTPLPGYDQPPSLISKENLDGVVFTLNDEGDRWEHTSTFSALAFVLASKRDTRFVYHARDSVLAFESGSQNRGGNVYIYRSSESKEVWAKQSVLRVGEGSGGSLLGVACVRLKDGKNRIICLTETQIVTISGIL